MHCDRTPARTLNFLSNGQVSTNSRKWSETYVSELVLEGLGEGFQNQNFLDLESDIYTASLCIYLASDYTVTRQADEKIAFGLPSHVYI